MTYKFPYEWNLSDGYPAKGINNNGLNVFGTFICGGGSTMGYKLAGYNHLGGVEIDKPITDVYKVNHNPLLLYHEDIRDFIKRDAYPDELYNLDILDGSPPCSTFSMAGSREKAWGKKKKFREGQKHQILDDLFFEFIKLTGKLKPKVVVAENVKGMIQGNARAYVNEVINKFKEAGYNVQLFLLNAASMGVPQKRERVFFICSRKDLRFNKLKLDFKEESILFKTVDNGSTGKEITGEQLKYWNKCKPGDSLSKSHPNGNYFGSIKVSRNKVCNTIVASEGSPLLHSERPMVLSDDSLKKIGSYPLDYNFKKTKPKYLIGMSVPPVMMAQIAHQIYLQWFNLKGLHNG